MTLIIMLTLGHLLASFAFLGDYLAKARKSNKLLLIAASLIWASTIWLILDNYFLASYRDFFGLHLGHLFVSHWRLPRANKRHHFRIYLFLEWVANIGLIYLAYKY